MVADAQLLEQLPEMGRSTDTVLGHLSLGEIVIPRALLDDPEVMQTLQAIFDTYQTNMAEFIVGDPANKINPETGYPEFFFKKIKNVFKKIAPIASIALPFVAPGLGSAIGAGLGLTGTAAGVAGNALVGGGLNALSGGGVKGALTGAALGGLGSAVSGYTASKGLTGGLDPSTGVTWNSGRTLGNAVGGGTSSLTGGNSNLLGSALKIGGSIYEDKSTRKNNEKIRQQYLADQARSEAFLNPYLQTGNLASNKLSEALTTGFSPGDLTQDPGYQFRLQQGQEALNRQLAASGLSQSGAALKAAQEYGQGLADQTYNDAYQRYLQQNQGLLSASNSGLNAASGLADINTQTGLGNAAILAANQESKNKRLSGILTGLGFGG